MWLLNGRKDGRKKRKEKERKKEDIDINSIYRCTQNTQFILKTPHPYPHPRKSCHL
jgi:hypothetical protein